MGSMDWVLGLLAWIVAFGPGLASPASPPAATGPSERSVFEARHELQVDVPEHVRKLRVWFVLPQDEEGQQVEDLEIRAPHPYRIVRDSEQNRLIYVEVDHPDPGRFTVVTTFDLARSEIRTDRYSSRPYTEADRARHERYLEPDTYIVINDRVRELAAEIVDNERDPVRASRKIYDWILAHADYWVKDPDLNKPSGVGSTTYCLNTGTGNCTDFHSLYVSLARASRIPARMVYGSLFKAELDGRDEDQSYHCWVEFYAPDLGWVSADVALADLYAEPFEIDDRNRELVNRTTPDGYRGPDPEKVDYYFGNLEPRRVTFSRGRDLILDPPQAGGPVNALPKAYVEVDGRTLAENEGWTRRLTYRERE